MEKMCVCEGGNLILDCCGLRYPSLRKYPNIDLKTCSKYVRWYSARIKVFEVLKNIESYSDSSANGNIIIIGAGSCLDLPIDYICETFLNVVLVDIDEKRLNEADRYIPVKLRKKVTKVIWDVTNFNEKIIDSLFRGDIKTCDDLVNKLNTLSKNIDIEIPFAIQNMLPFGFVMSDLIISQLPIRIIEIARDIFKEDITEICNDYYNNLAINHLKLLDKLASYNGKVAILTDPYAIGADANMALANLNSLLKIYGKKLLQPNFITKDMLNEWMSIYPVSKGSNIMETIESISLSDLNLDNIYNWWWTYSDRIWFLVVCYVFTKKRYET